jgi:hypothetical protein
MVGQERGLRRPSRSATPDGTGGCSTPAAVAGYPHITVPAGFVHGLPVGMVRAGDEGSPAAALVEDGGVRVAGLAGGSENAAAS